MRTLCNRYNSQKLIDTLQPWGSKMSLNARWQVSVKDENGQCYGHFFTAKPTRKQIRKLHNVQKHYLSQKCYECGKKIELGKEFTFDDLNYAHNDCLRIK